MAGLSSPISNGRESSRGIKVGTTSIISEISTTPGRMSATVLKERRDTRSNGDRGLATPSPAPTEMYFSRFRRHLRRRWLLYRQRWAASGTPCWVRDAVGSIIASSDYHKHGPIDNQPTDLRRRLLPRRVPEDLWSMPRTRIVTGNTRSMKSPTDSAPETPISFTAI